MPAKKPSTSIITADHDQGRKATDLFRHAYNGVGLDSDRAQLLNESPDFPDALDKLIRVHSRVPTISDAFVPLGAFELTVPADYFHAGFLDRFRSKNKKAFKWGNSAALTDKNFGNPTHVLVPGKTYLVKRYAIKSGLVVSSADCMDVYRAERAYYTGAPGVAMIWQEKRDELPVGKWTLSFDEESRLWVDAAGYHGVPSVHRYSDGDFGFALGYLEHPWVDDFVLALFCDLPATPVAEQPSGT